MSISIKDPVIKKEQAIKAAGNATKLARMLGISKSSVSDWGETIPPLQAYRLLQIYPDLKGC